MTMIPESHQDLLTAEVAILATIGQDGYPQAQPECTLFILDTANPYRTLEIRARGDHAGCGLCLAGLPHQRAR